MNYRQISAIKGPASAQKHLHHVVYFNMSQHTDCPFIDIPMVFLCSGVCTHPHPHPTSAF